MNLLEVLPERFFIDTLTIATYDEFFALGPPCMYWWQDPQKDQPWPTIQLAQKTAVRLWHGRVQVIRMGDYLVWCNSDPIEIGVVRYSAHEINDLKIVSVPEIASSLSEDLWVAWIVSKKLTHEESDELNSDS